MLLTLCFLSTGTPEDATMSPAAPAAMLHTESSGTQHRQRAGAAPELLERRESGEAFLAIPFDEGGIAGGGIAPAAAAGAGQAEYVALPEDLADDLG